MPANQAPLFSVVVPTHNRADLLPEALMSLTIQTFTDFEVLIVDDGSTDATPRLLDPIRNTGCLPPGPDARHRIHAKVLKQRHLGVSRARTLALRTARGRYFANLDSDDLWRPSTLDTLARAVREHDEPAVVQAPAAVFRHRGEFDIVDRTAARPPARRWKTLAAHAEDHGLSIGTNTGIVRRDVIPRQSAFPDINAARSDTFFFLRLLDEGPFVKIEGPPLVGYRSHRGSISRNPRMVADGLRYIVHWHGRHGFGRAPRTRAIGDRLVAHLCRHFTRELLREGHVREAWGVFRASARLHVSCGRWGYAARFPLAAGRAAALAALRSAKAIQPARPA